MRSRTEWKKHIFDRGEYAEDPFISMPREVDAYGVDPGRGAQPQVVCSISPVLVMPKTMA